MLQYQTDKLVWDYPKNSTPHTEKHETHQNRSKLECSVCVTNICFTKGSGIVSTTNNQYLLINISVLNKLFWEEKKKWKIWICAREWKPNSLHIAVLRNAIACHRIHRVICHSALWVTIKGVDGSYNTLLVPDPFRATEINVKSIISDVIKYNIEDDYNDASFSYFKTNLQMFWTFWFCRINTVYVQCF